MKRNTKAKLKNIFLGTLAGITILSGLAFVGCEKEPENPTPDNKVPPIVEIQLNQANSVQELETNYPQQLEAFVGSQLDKVLEDLDISENLIADYVMNADENGVSSIVFTFEYNHHAYTATATFASSVTFETIANFEEDIASTHAGNQAIDASQTQHEKEYILNHVENYEALEKTYPEKLKQYLNTQFSYAFENQGLKESDDDKVKNRTQQITADENGIQKVEFTFSLGGREQILTVEYPTPIAFDQIANYPEHQQSKEEVVEAMMSAKTSHEIPLSSYTDEEILSLFQDQINANLYNALVDCANAFYFGYSNELSSADINKYQWRLGEITDGKVQNLQLYIEQQKTAAGATRSVFEVVLKNPTSLADLAKANNPAKYQRITTSNEKFFYGWVTNEQRGYFVDWRNAINDQLPLKVNDFDFEEGAKDCALVVSGGISNIVTIYMYYSVEDEIRCYYVGTTGNGTSTSEVLISSITKNLQNGKFEYGFETKKSCSLKDNALDWATPVAQSENSN